MSNKLTILLRLKGVLQLLINGESKSSILSDMLIKCIKGTACQWAPIAIGVYSHFLYSLVPIAIRDAILQHI